MLGSALSFAGGFVTALAVLFLLAAAYTAGKKSDDA